MSEIVETSRDPVDAQYARLDCLRDDYLQQTTPEGRRRSDFALRWAAYEARDVDPELRYRLATFGPEESLELNKSSDDKQLLWLIEYLKTRQGQLLFVPPGRSSSEPGYLGRFDRLNFYVGTEEYAFEDVWKEITALETRLSLHVPNLLRFKLVVESGDRDSIPCYDLSPPKELGPSLLPAMVRRAITPWPVLTDFDESGYDFSKRLNSYDVRARSWRDGLGAHRVLFGEEVERWFWGHNSLKTLASYAELLDTTEASRQPVTFGSLAD